MGMKSPLTIAATVAVLSSTVTYLLISPQPSSKDNYRENQGGNSLILPRETDQKNGTLRSEGRHPLPGATTARSGSISQSLPFHATPPIELDLQESPEVTIEGKKGKAERDKFRRDLIQSMRDNNLPQDHIRQMERVLAAESQTLPSSR
jgi:hypothetical protein